MAYEAFGDRREERDTRASQPIAVSVVIPVLNGAVTLAAQLDALVAQRVPGGFEVIVADNGSTDGTRDIAARFAGREPPVRVVDASHRRGVGSARNVGVRAARGDKVLFCDADDIAAPGWVAGMAAALDEADLVGGMVDYARLNPQFRDRPRRSALFWEGPVRWPVGACCGWRRDFLLGIGGYDESWPSNEDVEIGLRASLAGGRVGEAPDAVLHKLERGSRWRLARQFFHYGKTRPRLVRAYPGMAEHRSTLGAARQWARLIWRTLRYGPEHLTVQRAAHNVGRLAGSYLHRTWAP